MLGESGNQQFSNRIYNYLYDVTKMRLQQWPLDFENSSVPIELIHHYISGAHFSLLKWWITSDEPCSIDELIKYNVQLFTNDPLSLLGLNDQIMEAIRKI